MIEPPEIEAAHEPDHGLTSDARSHMRGSTLLLVGRLLATVGNFVAQVLIVRHLDKSGFGAFAYGLAIVTIGESVATLGLDRAVTRFVPMYEEQRDDARAAGIILVVVGSIVALSLAVVATLVIAQDAFAGSFDSAPARTAVLVLVLLIPVQALDNLLIGLFAVFAQPRAIFFRRYVVAPVLRLLVVALVVWRNGDEVALAIGYVAAGAFGVAVYSAIFVRALARTGRLRRYRRQRAMVPLGSMLRFTLPLLSTDVVQLLISSFAIVLMGKRGDATGAAAVRAVQPIANLNQIVLLSFGVLFTPLVSRLHARDDDRAIGELYRRSSAMVAVLSFPVFLVSFALARPVAVALFGERYASSGTVLAILAAAQFVNAVLGFNNVTLAVLGRVRQLLVINLVTIAVNVALTVWLVPRHGAVGAAVAIGSTLALVNVLRQIDLGSVGVHVFERRYAASYFTMLLVGAAVLGLQVSIDPPLAVGMAVAGTGALAVLVASRSALEITETFPELSRVPLLRSLLR